MPFIVIWPGHVEAGRIDTRSVVSGVDFLPTISKLCRIDIDEDWKLDGEDISDILLGTSREREKALMWRNAISESHFPYTQYHKSPMLSIRKGPWKLLVNPDSTDVELYYIPDDPAEFNNLAMQKPDIVRPMMHELMDWHGSLPYYDRVDNWSYGRYRWKWPEGEEDK